MRSLTWVLSIAIAVLLVAHQPAAAQARFKGELALTPLPDGRNMKLLQSFGFIDSKGVAWDVPAGLVTDGASVPRLFWLGLPPWTGKYRKAAVIHDHFCNTKSRSWQDTHNVFYDAMLTEGMNKSTAKLMWAAVYNFGERWERGEVVKRRAFPATAKEEEQWARDIQAWIERADPSLEDIAKAIDLDRIPK